MILQLFLGLITIALLFFLIGPERRRRIWSVLLFGAVLVLLYTFFKQIDAIGFGNVIYAWIPHKALQANLSFGSAEGLNILGGCFAALIYLNIAYRKETFSLYINNLILLNFAALIIILSSQDFLQLMVGSSCFSIVGFYLINDIGAKTKFIFYNFLGELAIFTALAVVYASLDSIMLSALPQYLKHGHHKDLVAILILCGIFVKCGMFLFQNQLIDIKTLNFNRVIAVAMFSTPLSGAILFGKLFPLIASSELSYPLFSSILIASAVLGVGGALLNDNLKAKVLYLNMLFYAFLLWQMWGQPQIFFEKLIYLYIPLLSVYAGLMFVSVSASDEVYVSQMGGFARKLWLNFILSLLCIFAFAGVFVALLLTLWPLGVFLGILAATYHSIYFGKSQADERVEAWLKNIGIQYWLPFVLILGCLIYDTKLYQQVLLWKAFGVFIALMLIVPSSWLEKLSENNFVQEGDLLHRVYNLLILAPLRFLGRVLWIAIDFVVIERSIIGSVSHSTRFIVKGLQSVQNAYWINYLVMVLLGFCIILINIGWYYYG